MLTDVDKEFDTPIEDENGELIETIELEEIFEEEDTGLEEKEDSFYGTEEDLSEEDSFYETEEAIVEAKENYKSTKEELVAIFTSILEKGEITAEDNVEIESLKEDYSEAYNSIKENIQRKEKKTLEERLDELKEGFVGATSDEILNILTENGTKCWLYKDDDDNVLIDGTSIPELTVLVNKFKMIATDGENEGEFTLNPDFIQMVVKDTGTGNAVKSIDNMYYLSTSKYELIGGTWVSILPTSQEQQGKFLWIKTVTTYMDTTKEPTETQPICLTGQDGTNGADGVDGQDGTSIIWKGTHSKHPSNPQNGWAYYNSTDKKSYVFQSGAWYQMTIDGQDGQNGNDGKDGLSIEYKGTMSNPPSNPKKNWTYKDSDNGIVYIYTGIAWEVLTYDGNNGIDGTNGTDGLSVFCTYHDSTAKPATPTGNGTLNGWHTDWTSSVVWVSQKVSGSATTGTWGTPIKIKGQDGVSYYTWIMYADDEYGNGISNDPTGKEYIGFAYNKTTPIESTNRYDYTWSLIKGTDGVPGQPGQDGTTYYTWIKYSDYSNGNPCYDIPNNNTKYIGIATNKITQYESSDYTQYKWSLFKGADGVPGQDGVSVEEVVIEYAKNQSTISPPTSGWSTTMPAYQSGYYLWMRTRIKYSNSSNYVYSTPVCDESWKVNAQTYSEYKQLRDKFSWIVKSGTSSSNMELTDKMYSLMTKKVLIEAKKIELNGSIDINNGTFKVATNGNTKIGGLCTHTNSDGTSRGIFEVTSSGTVYSRHKTNQNIYTMLTEGKITVKNDEGTLTFTNGQIKVSDGSTATYYGDGYIGHNNSIMVETPRLNCTQIVTATKFTSGTNAILRSELNSSTNGAGGSVYLCCNGGDYNDTDSRVIRYFKNNDGNYVFRPNSQQGVMYNGTATYPWKEVIAKKLTQTSDRTLKENITYLSNAKSIYDSNNDITINDCYNFVDKDLPIALYNYINDNDKKIGFIAQDLLYNADESDNKVGQLIVNPKGYTDEDGKLTYDLGNYVSVLAGALQVVIRKIKQLEGIVNGSE